MAWHLLPAPLPVPALSPRAHAAAQPCGFRSAPAFSVSDFEFLTTRPQRAKSFGWSGTAGADGEVREAEKPEIGHESLTWKDGKRLSSFTGQAKHADGRDTVRQVAAQAPL